MNGESTGHYDFRLSRTPDETQFGGFRPPTPPTDNTNGPPDLFTAMQEQRGLKMQVAKLPVDALVIDKAKQPSLCIREDDRAQVGEIE